MELPEQRFAAVLLTEDSNYLEIPEMTDWFPIVFFTFKIVALSIGMFIAIKWHYDQGKKHEDKKQEKRAVLRATGVVAAVFVLLLVGLGLLTYVFATKLGLDLRLP